MPITLSPLRYPGGKTQLFSLVHTIIQSNSLIGCSYIEPFAGGAGLAIKLLLKGIVKEITINDSDYAIYAIWYSILNYTDRFCETIENCLLTIPEWNYYKELYNNSDDIFKLGFAAFYLNRTNISGIIKGGVIGGISQKGNYRINSRFNKKTLIDKIINISKLKGSISLYNMDIFNFIKTSHFNRNNSFINFDPPYVKKGRQLYKNSFNLNDHILLARKILTLQNNWIVTYDICDLIKQIYSTQRFSFLDINYSIGSTRNAKEILFYSDSLNVPTILF